MKPVLLDLLGEVIISCKTFRQGEEEGVEMSMEWFLLQKNVPGIFMLQTLMQSISCICSKFN